MNCGAGTPQQRMAAVLWNMVHANSSVTRWVCAEIIARRIVREELSKGEDGDE